MNKNIVLVTWKDTAVFPSIVAPREQAKEKARIAVISQAGFLISEDSEKVVLGWQYHKVSNKFEHITAIPRSSILEIKTLGEF